MTILTCVGVLITIYSCQQSGGPFGVPVLTKKDMASVGSAACRFEVKSVKLAEKNSASMGGAASLKELKRIRKERKGMQYRVTLESCI